MSRSSASHSRRVILETVPGAVGLVGDLEYRAVGLDTINTHARHADKDILVAIQCHAERTAADPGKFLPTLVVGARKRMIEPLRLTV